MKRYGVVACILILTASSLIVAQEDANAIRPAIYPSFFFGVGGGCSGGYYTGVYIPENIILLEHHYPSQITYGYWSEAFLEFVKQGNKFTYSTFGIRVSWSEYRTALEQGHTFFKDPEDVAIIQGTRRAFLYLGLPAVELYLQKRIIFPYDNLYFAAGIGVGFPIATYYEEVLHYEKSDLAVSGLTKFADGTGWRAEERSLYIPPQLSIHAGLQYEFELKSWPVVIGINESNREDYCNVRIRPSITLYYGLSDISHHTDSFHYLRYGVNFVIPLGWGYPAIPLTDESSP